MLRATLVWVFLARRRTASNFSRIVTSNRGPDEWLATFADPVRAQSAIDRFTSNAYDLIIERESYRPRLKPRLPKEGKERSR
jgi:DNA replication protein DnaC